MLGAGIAHDRKRFITHTTLHHRYSALHTFAPWQRNFGLLILVAISIGLILDPLLTGIIIIAVLSSIYFIDVFFNLGLVLKSLKTPPEIESTKAELQAISDAELPIYSILCPLYKESHMLPGFVAAIEKLHWPHDKLDVLLLLEENDPETVKAAEVMQLPAYVRIIVVPHSEPKTKPKACNYGLSLARGEYTVIYDAEDIPDPWQLKKAFLGFQKSGPEVKCLQAKLNYFNPEDNLLTRFFTAEYSLWFDIILVGLQSINTSIPLGGTSNHFRTRDLIDLEGWDPFNVTEDCDLGVRIFKRGSRTAIIDSVTLEEANGHVRNWLRQRSRWIKGYMQTYLVHMRHPVSFLRQNGIHALLFQLIVGAKLSFLFINPILWLTTIAYFVLYSYVGPTIEALYPTWIFYMAAISLVFGNFFYLYYYMVGCAKRHHWPLIKYVFFVPLYWILGSTAAYIALYELLVKPHYWQKTVHGLNLVHAKKREEKAERRQVMRDGLKQLAFWQMGPVMENIADRLKRWFPDRAVDFVFSGKGFLMAAFLLSSVFNFLFNAFLGRVLSFDQLALVTFVNTLWYIVTIFVAAFGSTINHRTSYLVARKGREEADLFFKVIFSRSFFGMLAISVLWIMAIPIVAKFFQIADPMFLLFFTPSLLFGLISYGSQGFLQGNLRFAAVGVICLFESLTKLLFAAALISFNLQSWVYTSIPLSLVISGLLAWFLVSRRVSFSGSAIHTSVLFPKSFFFSSLLTSISAIVFLSVDVLLVKHFFPEEQAGQYALLSLVGKMIFFFGALPTTFMVTMVSRQDGLRKSSRKILFVIGLSVLGLSAIGVFFLGVLGSHTVPFFFGGKAEAIVSWLPTYTISIALFTLSNVIVLYRLAKRHYFFSFLSLGISSTLAVMVWLNHDSISSVVRSVFDVSLTGLLALTLLHLLDEYTPSLRRAGRDFVGLFKRDLPQALPAVETGKRVLIFNWRDITHTYAGGAEVYVHEIAKEWVRLGHHVTLFSGNDGKQKRYEKIDGVQMIRRGGVYLVYLWAFGYYLFQFRNRYDIVIDCENGIPFFTPLYVRKPVYCLMHHVHQDVFFHSLPRPLAWFASFLEKTIMPLIYRKVKFITVSQSSKEEMEEHEIGRAGIYVVHPGINQEEFSRVLYEKTTMPTILYLGRLKSYKSINVLIQAFRIVLSERPDARLVIAGSGDEEDHLKRLAKELRLTSEQVQFVGQVSHAEKVRLLQSSWMLVNPSFMEGWGIVGIEANACGTPVIASNVPGLRDSVQHGRAGYLLPYGDVAAFSESILTIIRDRELRLGMEANARVWAGNFSWQKSGAAFLSVISHD